MASFPLACRQVNIGRSRFAASQLLADICSAHLSFVFVQEPFVIGRKAARFGSFGVVCGSDSGPRACIVINSPLPYTTVFCDDLVNAIFVEGLKTLMVNVYIPPDEAVVFDRVLNNLVEIITTKNWENLLVLGDFNAKHATWGSPFSDSRGLAVVDLVNQFDLDVVNSPEGPPTFVSSRGKSWIDLT